MAEEVNAMALAQQEDIKRLHVNEEKIQEQIVKLNNRSRFLT